MSKIKRKLIAVLCAVMMFSTVITGYAANFGDLVLTTKIPDEIVVYSSDFSDGTYERAAFADSYAPADLAGKDFIPVYTDGTEVPDASKLIVTDSISDTYAGNLLREDKNYEHQGTSSAYNYLPKPSGWYPETQNTDIVIGNDDGNKYIYTADESTNAGKPSYYAIRKTIQNFYNDYGPGTYKIKFKAKSILSQPRPNGYYDFGFKLEVSNYGKYTNNVNLDSYDTLATQANYRVYEDWRSFEFSTTIPELGESAATNEEFYNMGCFTNDVFSIRIGSWNSEGLMPFAIDDFEIVKEVVPSIVSVKGKSVTLSHTIYNNAKHTGDTTAKDAVVITALYDGDSKLVTADYAEVTGITDTATATTTISVPNDADETYYSKSFLWNDFSEVIPYSLSTDSFDKNLIENGGFEILSGSTSAANWQTATLDSANAHTGKYAVKVTKTGQAAYNQSDIYSILKENGVGTYKVSFYVKTDCTTSLKARCLLRSGKSDGAVKDVVHEQFNITASDGWKKMEYTGTIDNASDINTTENSQNFFVGFLYGANQEGISLWFDDIRIEKIN